MKKQLVPNLFNLSLITFLVFISACSPQSKPSGPPDESALSLELKLSILLKKKIPIPDDTPYDDSMSDIEYREYLEKMKTPPIHLRFALKNTGKGRIDGDRLLSKQPHIRIVSPDREPIELAIPKEVFASLKLAPGQSHHWHHAIADIIQRAELKKAIIHRIAWSLSTLRSNELPILIKNEETP